MAKPKKIAVYEVKVVIRSEPPIAPPTLKQLEDAILDGIGDSIGGEQGTDRIINVTATRTDA